MARRNVKIQYRVRGGNQETFQKFMAGNEQDSSGLRILMVKNAVVVEWPSLWFNDRHRIYSWITGGEFLIVADETGGYDGLEGFSEVFCGRSGESILSINREHGIFIGRSICSVVAKFIFGQDSSVSIYEYSLVLDQTSVRIERALLADEEYFEELTNEDLAKFKHATHAAVARANCYQCAHIHYGKTQE
jgi:hypothetical protein